MSPTRTYVARRGVVAVAEAAGSSGSAYGGLLPARLPESTGSVVSATTFAALQSALASVPFGGIIDLGGATIDLTYSLRNTILYWNRNPPSPYPVTTIRNGILTGMYLGVLNGSYLRFRNIESRNAVGIGGSYSAGFGFRCEGLGTRSHHIEWDNCYANNAALSGWMIQDKSDYWQIWNSIAHSCGQQGTAGHSHAMYLEAHSLNCVVANCLLSDWGGFGLHVSTDALAANALTDGIICTGITSLNGDNPSGSALITYSAQGDVTQTNCIFCGIAAKNAPSGIAASWENLAANNRIYGGIQEGGTLLASNTDFAPVYFNGSAVVSGIKSGAMLLDVNGRPAGGSAAKHIVPAAQYGYLPALDRDGLARLTADAGCYRVPAAGSLFGALLPARLPQSTGTNYYVSPSGNDTSGDGSIGAPWATIQKAFNTVPLNGSIINLRAGSYTAASNYSQWTRVGDSTNPVTIQNYPGETAILNAQRLLVSGSGAYLRIKGLEIKDVGATQENGIKIEGSAHHVEIVGCYIHDNSRTGIMVITGNHLQIWDCIIANNGTPGSNQDHGIYWSASSGVANSNCVIANCVIYLSSGYNIQHYSNPSGVIITCTTLDDCKQTLANGGRGGIVIGTESGNSTSNNIIVGMISTSAPGEGYDRYVPAGTFTGNNVYDSLAYDNDGGDFGAGAGITYTNCTSANPLYVNQAARNYDLQAGSPAIDKIQAARYGYVPPLDINGNPRVTADAGAYAI